MYLRKSRSDNPQESVAEVLARHERQLQEYAIKTFGYRIKETEIYREVVSGETIDDRPEINKMFKRMEDPSVKGILVIEPQRLTRGDLLDCGTIVHLFRYTNTLIITPTKSYDLSDKFDRKFFEMELTRGNDYLEYTKEILARGRKASVKEGNYLGNYAPYGYERTYVGKSPTLKINPEEANYIRLIFDMFVNQHKGFFLIASTLTDLGAKPRIAEHFNPVSIKAILKNEVYIGKIRTGVKTQVKTYENGKLIKKMVKNSQYELVQGKHESLITEELFYKAQERMGRIPRTNGNSELRNIYAGLLKCKKCGKSVGYFSRVGRQVDQYRCRGHRYCDNISCNVDIMQRSILNGLKNELKELKAKISEDAKGIEQEYKSLIDNLNKELSDLEIRQEKLYDYLEKGVYSIDVFMSRNEALAQERKRLQESIKNANEKMPTVEAYEKKYTSLKEAIRMIQDDTATPAAINSFLKDVIDVIYYEKNQKTITGYGGRIEAPVSIEIKLK